MLITDKKVLVNYTASKCLWLGIPSIEVTKKDRPSLHKYRVKVGRSVITD